MKSFRFTLALTAVLLFTLVSVRTALSNNPVAVITGFSPSFLTVGDPNTVIHVFGSDFLPSSVVQVNRSNRSTTFISSTELTVVILSSDLRQADWFPVSVYNPAPGGGNSDDLGFTVLNPLPMIGSISPSSMLVGSDAFRMRIVGYNFVDGSVVRFNGSDMPTKFVDNQHLIISLSTDDLSTAGSYFITVYNPAPGGGSPEVGATFTVTSGSSSGSGSKGGSKYRTAASTSSTNYQLNQNFPEPFNPTTTISFVLVAPSVVTLKVYNMLGQEVASLLNNAQMQTGTQLASFDASNLPSGTYIYRLEAKSTSGDDDSFVSVRKMSLIK